MNESRYVAVVVTGDRDAVWEAWRQTIRNVLKDERFQGKYGVLIHGGARGIDRHAGRIGGMHGWQVIPMEAKWRTEGYGAGPRRNRRMLTMLEAMQEQGYDVEVLAFHDDLDGKSKGTRDMVDIARNAGIKATVYTHDGCVVGHQLGMAV